MKVTYSEEYSHVAYHFEKSLRKSGGTAADKAVYCQKGPRLEILMMGEEGSYGYEWRAATAKADFQPDIG